MIRQLQASDVDAYRALRLEGLRLHPRAFGGALAEEVAAPADFWLARLRDAPTFGGFGPDGALLGIATLKPMPGAWYQHRAMLVGLYVAAAGRGSGMAAGLIRAVADAAAAGGALWLELGVGLHNAPAIALYQRMGFRPFAVEPDAMCVDGTMVDEILMRLRLRG
jgi:ribosomal protein S18 acetylase RimI-like enzyme